MTIVRISSLVLIWLLLISCSKSPDSTGVTDTTAVAATTGVFSKAQAERGALLYTSNCAACHGAELRGTEGGTALVGELFESKWKDKTVGALFELTRATMPKTNPRSLDDASYSALLAFILTYNDFPSGEVDLPS